MKILYAVNTSCDKVIDYVKDGNEFPKTYLWWDYLNPDTRHELIFIDNRKGNKVIEFIGKTFFIPNIQYQIDAIRKQNEYDVIFCSLDHFHVLIYLCRFLRILKKPIFGISHYSFNYKVSTESWYWKMRWKIYSNIAILGFDYIAFLYESLLKKSLELNNLPERARNVIQWGADVDFFDKYVPKQSATTQDLYFMSIGSSNRDYDLLIEAFRSNSYNLKIYQKLGFFSTNNKKIPPNVIFDDKFDKSSSLSKHQSIREAYKESYAVLIPLEKQYDNLTGITVLLEAIACGKAVVITDNVLMPFDVEEEGIGIKVKYGDKQGWINAVNYLMKNPDETKKMGKKAYLLSKTKYNYNNYKRNLANEFFDFTKNLSK